MRQGTVSVLIGCHSPAHSLGVLWTWHKLYHKWPSWWEIVCIFLHDIGHWGKDYLDDYEAKKQHWILGARVARCLFGQRGYDLVAGHVPFSGAPKSRLHDPDKYSWIMTAPLWWLVSNQLVEPKLQRPGNTKLESARMFRAAMRENARGGFTMAGHDVYLRQWRGSMGTQPVSGGVGAEKPARDDTIGR